MESFIERADDGVKVIQRDFLEKVYGWMFAGLALTGVVAWLVFQNPAISSAVFANSTNMWLLFGGQLALVWILSARIGRMSSTTAFIMFVIYAALNGVTLSVIFYAYTLTSIASTFGITALTFGAMSLYGYFTKSDLSSWGSYLFMGLIGLIIASLVNWFLGSSSLDWIISIVGVLIFVGLTAYDTWRIKNMSTQFTDAESHNKGALMGALMLYLDFINLFLYLLRFLGDRN